MPGKLCWTKTSYKSLQFAQIKYFVHFAILTHLNKKKLDVTDSCSDNGNVRFNNMLKFIPKENTLEIKVNIVYTQQIMILPGYERCLKLISRLDIFSLPYMKSHTTHINFIFMCTRTRLYSC